MPIDPPKRPQFLEVSALKEWLEWLLHENREQAALNESLKKRLEFLEFHSDHEPPGGWPPP